MKSFSFHRDTIKTLATFDYSKSKCPVCGPVDIDIVEADKKVFFIRECGHGGMMLKEKNLDFYNFVMNHSLTRENPRLYVPFDRFRDVSKDTTDFMLRVTDICHSSCPVCFADASDSGIHEPLDSIANAIEKVDVKGKTLHIVGGGEATTREDLPEIIKLVVKSGNVPLLVTNGDRLADESYTRSLRRAGLGHVEFSFEGLGDEAYEKLRGNFNLLDIKLRALRNLEINKMNVCLAMTIVRNLTDKEILSTMRFAIENKHLISGILCRSLTLHGRLKNVKPEQRMTLLEILESIESNSGGRITVEDFMEWKRLRFNLYRLLFGMGIRSATKIAARHYSADILIDANEPKPTPFFRTDELRDANALIESVLNKKTNIIMCVKLLTNRKFRILMKSYIRSLFGRGLWREIFEGKDFIRLTITDTAIPQYNDLRIESFGGLISPSKLGENIQMGTSSEP